MAFTPTDPTKAEVRVTGTAPNQELDFYIPRGAKGEPGGFNVGTDLSTTDLNLVLTPGLYRQATSGNATTAKNYPVMNASVSRGVLTVTAWSTAVWAVTQEYAPFGSVVGTSVFYRRTCISDGVWTAWKAFTSQRVDQTAGRVVYAWDELNGREQIVYGDTGWRNINADIPERSGGNVFIRRKGDVVTFMFEGFVVTGQAPAMAINLPYLGNSILTGTLPIGTGNHSTAFPHTFTYRWNGAHALTFGSTAAASGCASFPSRDTWPTTLPGIAYGTLAYN